MRLLAIIITAELLCGSISASTSVGEARVGDNETISGKKSQLSESLTKVYRSGGWGAREKATYRSV